MKISGVAIKNCRLRICNTSRQFIPVVAIYEEIYKHMVLVLEMCFRYFRFIISTTI